MRVLIIDDSMVMRRIVETALRHSGVEITEVLVARNGSEGLAVLEQTAAPLDLILCDVHMPVLDGPGFLLEKRNRNLAPQVPVVMITADTSDPHLLRSIAAGAQGYIAKPFTLEQMHAGIAPVLRSRSQHPNPAPLATEPVPATIGGAP
jgi:two-component system chemotaxis response regulator CheY